MTDPAEPDVPQKPPAGAQGAAPQDADARSNTEISEPTLGSMWSVHAEEFIDYVPDLVGAFEIGEVSAVPECDQLRARDGVCDMGSGLPGNEIVIAPQDQSGDPQGG